MWECLENKHQMVEYVFVLLVLHDVNVVVSLIPDRLAENCQRQKIVQVHTVRVQSLLGQEGVLFHDLIVQL